MTDHLELNLEVLGKTLREKAFRFRHLAGEILDGEFRSNLLELALDYDRQAANLERGDATIDG